MHRDLQCSLWFRLHWDLLLFQLFQWLADITSTSLHCISTTLKKEQGKHYLSIEGSVEGVRRGRGESQLCLTERVVITEGQGHQQAEWWRVVRPQKEDWWVCEWDNVRTATDEWHCCCHELAARRDERVKPMIVSFFNNSVKRDVMIGRNNLKGQRHVNEQLMQMLPSSRRRGIIEVDTSTAVWPTMAVILKKSHSASSQEINMDEDLHFFFYWGICSCQHYVWYNTGQ